MSSFLNVQREKLEEAAKQQEARRIGWSARQRNETRELSPAQIASQKVAPPIVSRIVNGTETSGYEAVGKIGDTEYGYGCSGTLIGSRYVLTAAHCAEGVGNREGKFQVNGQNYRTSKVIVHPNYNSNTLANDIAIYELDRDVEGVTPVDIFRGTPRVGQELTLVGFGAGGNGNSGHNGDYGTKRVGKTDIDGVSGREITWTFDNNSESNTAPGDSGGAAFVTVGGKLYLAGVTSGGTRDDAGIGDESYDTRVDAFKSWIDANTDGGGSNPDPDPDPNADDHSNSFASATVLTLNSRNVGRDRGKIETKSDRDMFEFTVDRSGKTIINARGSGGLDTHLKIYDADRKLVATNDNRRLNSTDSQVRTDLSKGTYFAAVTSSGGSSTGNYKVVVRHEPGGSSDSGDDHGNRIGQATEVALNSAGKMDVNAKIEKGNDTDFFKVTANKSGTMRFQTSATTGNLDTILTVYDKNGRKLKTNDDTGFSLDSRIDINVKSGNDYFVKVSSYDTTRGNYRLSTSMRNDRSGKSNSLRSIDLSQDQLNSLTSTNSRSNRIGSTTDRSSDREMTANDSLNICDMKLSQMRDLLSDRPNSLAARTSSTDMLNTANNSAGCLAGA